MVPHRAAGFAECQLHHTAYLVQNLDVAVRRWSECLGAAVERGPVNIVAHGVRVCFVLLPSGGRIELVQPLEVPKLVRWERPDHVCFICEGFDKRIARVHEDGGIVVRPPVPSEAFAGRRMCFVLYQGVGLIELVER